MEKTSSNKKSNEQNGGTAGISCKKAPEEICGNFHLTAGRSRKKLHIHPRFFHHPSVENPVENVDNPSNRKDFSRRQGCGKLSEKSA